MEGFYSFVADDGKKYFVTYVADKTGYHPTVVSPEDVVQINVDAEEIPTLQAPVSTYNIIYVLTIIILAYLLSYNSQFVDCHWFSWTFKSDLV